MISETPLLDWSVAANTTLRETLGKLRKLITSIV